MTANLIENPRYHFSIFLNQLILIELIIDILI